MNTTTKQKKGLEFESWVYNKLKDEWGLTLNHCTTKEEQYTKGENYQGWEIKNDQTFNKTNNLYISVERRYSNNVYPSGLYKEQEIPQRFYVIGNKKECYVFSTKILKQYYENYKCQLIPGFTTNTGGKEYGFLLNKEYAERLCVGKFVNQYNLL